MQSQAATLAQRIDDDHHRLRDTVRQLLEALEDETPKENFLIWKLEFLSRMRDFQHQLLKHFDLEELGGFMDTVLRTAPQYARQVDQLEIEHDDLIKDLDRAIATFKGADCASSPKVMRARERVRELVSALDAHEAVENELIQNVYNQDLGLGD